MTDRNASQSQDILNKSETDILGSELDGQINDLLASIRKSEENQSNDSSNCDTPEEEITIDGIREISHDDKTDVDNDEAIAKNGEPVEDNEQNESTHNIRKYRRSKREKRPSCRIEKYWRNGNTDSYFHQVVKHQ
ncbi:unnamed protein product [Arctia plantaginis]|uniref:Uncharacterized protein n=1 Tax=Arctia plantaginis TaxID=874455 RepID=A0A8S1ADR6_ARCPL|nr:unnamed protein product [Arctia plantaginis]